MLVGLAVDSQLRQDNLSFVRIASNEMDGGELFAGRAAQTFPVDSDRRPTVSVGLCLEPSADCRFKSLDINRPKDDRERTLGQGLGVFEAQSLDDVRRQISPKVNNTLQPSNPSHHRQDQEAQDCRKRVSLSFGPTRIWDLLE